MHMTGGKTLIQRSMMMEVSSEQVKVWILR